MNKFKCTGKSSPICSTARGDTDELEGAFVKQPYVLHSIKFQNVCLCMSMYMWELFTRVFSKSSIPARYHTFVEIDHEIISTVILLPSADLFKKGCCQLQAKVCAQITG